LKFRKDAKPAAAAELFMKTAQQYIGYTTDLNGRNMFGQKVGYDSQPWSGAFVDVVAREAGLKIPSFTYTPAALAEFIRQGNFSREPRPGSVAIFNFSSNVGHAADAFGPPHCGIVIDVREFQETGRFITVEGNTEGTTKHLTKDGVYQRIRSINDVIVFCHPQLGSTGPTFNERLIKLLDRGRTVFTKEELKEIDKTASAPSILRINGEIKHGSRNKDVEVIQLALATVTDIRGAEPGKWDSITAAACSRYQRMIGYVGKDVSGLPDVNTLKRLARETKLFTVDL
jgi:hypothetical protein